MAAPCWIWTARWSPGDDDCADGRIRSGNRLRNSVDDVFLKVLDRLKQGEEIEQGFLGVKPENSPQPNQPGVILSAVERGTPARQAGLQEGDLITQIDEMAIRGTDDLFLQIGSLPPDHVAQIKLRRGRRELTLPVRLSKKPLYTSRPVVSTVSAQTWRGLEVDYGTALFQSRSTVLDPQGCVVARRVESDSPAWKAGLRPGVLISHVDGHRVTRPAEFLDEVEKTRGQVKLSTFGLEGRSVLLVEPR